MATVTFDTLELVDKLKKSGMSQDQAEAVIRTIADTQHHLVTKMDLQLELAPIRTDLAILKWMIGFVLAGIMALLLKLYI